jgi:hypothetical protein
MGSTVGMEGNDEIRMTNDDSGARGFCLDAHSWFVIPHSDFIILPAVPIAAIDSQPGKARSFRIVICLHCAIEVSQSLG